MDITVYNDGSIYKGRIVSYDLKWEGRQIDLAAVRDLDFTISQKRGEIKMKDGTRLALIKEGTFLARWKKLVLKGHIVVHVESLNDDIRFDVQRVERVRYERNGSPRELKSPDYARQQNGAAVTPAASDPRLAPTAQPQH